VSRESRELRRNLFTVQINPAPVMTKDLERRGLKVIPLEVPEGADATQTLHVWLEELVRRLGQNKAPQTLTTLVKVSNNNLPAGLGDLLGRKEEVARVLKGLRSRYPLIAIEGFPGIGKTSLALEVGHSCLSNRSDEDSEAVVFDYVAWISAKDMPDQRRWLQAVLNVVATTMNFPAITQRPLDERRREVDWLLRAYKVLLIIDNFETIDDPDLATWLEQIPEPSKVIITTRSQFQQKAWAVNLPSRKLHTDHIFRFARASALSSGVWGQPTRSPCCASTPQIWGCGSSNGSATRHSFCCP
jgi:hypothetical protein